MDIDSKDISETKVNQEAGMMIQPESIEPLEDITSTEEGKNLAEEINIDQSLPSSETNGIAETLSLKEKQNGEVSDSDTIPECDSDENIVIVMNETSKFNTRVKPDESAYTNFCNQCDAVFRWPYQLKNHISVAHEGKYPYNCKLCGKQFEHLKSFRDHKYVHTEERPYACELCPSRFKMRGGLNKHMRDIHIDTKVQFKCEYCSKTFKCKEKLINHFLVHTEEKAFACDICGKKFSRKTNMKEHRVTHSLEKDFECKECGMKFNRKYAMKIHMRNHLTVRPYKCEFCEKSFSQSHALKSHTRLHTGERPYKCQHCDRSFKQLGTLQVHTKRHLNEKNFKCGICDRAFIVQRRLNEHMRVHTGEKPYQCDFCPFRAATSTGLRCHKNTHERRLKRHMEEQESGNGPLVPKSIEEVIKQKMKPRLKPKIKPVIANKDNVNNNNGDIDKSVDPSKVAVKKEITETTDNQKEEKAVKAPVKKKRSPAKKKFQAAAALAQMKNQSSSNNVNGNARSLDAIVNKLKQSKSNVKQCFDVQSNSTRNIENIFVGGLNLCDMKDSKFTTIRETRMFADGVRRTIERKVRTSSLPNGNKAQKYAMSDRVVVLDSDSDSNSKDKTNHFRALNADPRLNYSHNQIAPMSSQPNRNINLAVSGKTKDEIYMEKVFANALLGSGDGRVSSPLDDKIMMQNLMNDNPNVINKAIENLANSITRAYYSDNEGRQPVSRSIPATITSNGGIKTEPGFDIQDLPIHDDNSSNEIHAGVKSCMNIKTFGELNTHMNSNEKQDNTKTFGELNTHMKTNEIQDNTKTFGELNTHMNMNVHLDSELNGADNNHYGNNHISITNKTIGVNNDVNSVVHLNGDSSTTDSNADNLEMNDPNSVSNDLNDVTYDVVQVCGSNT